jgi:hypothetical protein
MALGLTAYLPETSVLQCFMVTPQGPPRLHQLKIETTLPNVARTSTPTSESNNNDDDLKLIAAVPHFLELHTLPSFGVWLFLMLLEKNVKDRST